MIPDDISTDDRIITMYDVRRYNAGCVPGWRKYLESRGYNWRDIILNGLPASRVLQEFRDDYRVIAVVEAVYNEPKRPTPAP